MLSAILGITTGLLAILSLTLLYLLLRPSNQPRVLRGMLAKRQLRFGKVATTEVFERDSLKMTFNVELGPDHDALTIGAEGAADSVQRVTSVLTELLANNDTAVTRVLRRAPEADRLRSRFKIVKTPRIGARPTVEAEVDFTVLHTTGNQTFEVE
ncbi:hypothetical protein FHS29_002401 [Saccharothrix tamanrassetensis]|uniref:Uncharacterized protein n=1 Tax=Saccharothrix tamanrassetensis TaxID=1051531 RepID=A0A841CFQ0_9PSEU|nr:hypothetical protein [Saccharothrix tamanrassetensis]MBB5955820.1 hypothetical protein [Saccharothrix tamanrassetensis]